MARLTERLKCPFCDSDYVRLFVKTPEELKEHILKVHGRTMDFAEITIPHPSSETS